MKLVYFGVISAIQPSSALKNMKFEIKQITKFKHIVINYKNLKAYMKAFRVMNVVSTLICLVQGRIMEGFDSLPTLVF